ncbi:hypothetical protein DYI37_07880 [Fulvimarina endophytica]|uniref:Phytase-like domain-containing protein n=1 Tax=Fulvimarina endophytica TaxID=2293836 RepID=A0A371X4W1_9HYPH|nr:esterase-like activity of phytase family protein [Fulvimarina endophytica]RFC64250.1 hypothetical protein DYI37_07880 [Fulvimarina endophytica]
MPVRPSLRLAAPLLACLLAGTAEGGATGVLPVTITAQPIAAFDKGSKDTRFGALRFVGGFSFTARGASVGGLSGLVLRHDGRDFLAVSDDGRWLSGRIARDENGVPTGLEEAESAPMLGAGGVPLDGKTDADAEGLARRGADEILVSFERRPRILAYRGFPRPFASVPETLDQPVPLRELRINKGLEALAVSPEASPLEGAVVTIAEGSIDEAGNLFAGILDGPQQGVFKLRKDERWQASDADFLPGGDLLVLERRYEGFFGGLGTRIRRIAGGDITRGALVDGPVIFEADLGQEIDNLEGLAVWSDASGATRLTLISDDNHSFLQRNLLLEFVLEDDRR